MKKKALRPVIDLNEKQLAHRDNILVAIETQQLNFISSACSCTENFLKFDFKIANYDAWGFPIPTYLCMACGLVRSGFIQTEESIKLFYEKFYFPHMFTCSSDLGHIGMDKQEYIKEEIGRGNRVLEVIVNTHNIDFEGKSILDVGCGAGGTLSVFMNQKADCYGVDFNTENLNYARAAYPTIKFELGGTEQFSDKKFDVILLCDVLEHVVEPRAFLLQILDKLNVGGILYINSPGLRGICNWRFNCSLKEFLKIEHTYCYNRQNLSKILSDVGFKVEHISESVECVASKSQITQAKTIKKSEVLGSIFTLLVLCSLPIRRKLRIDKYLFAIKKRIF